MTTKRCLQLWLLAASPRESYFTAQTNVSPSPDEALAQELAKKVEGLIKLKDEIDQKINTLPTKADIDNIQENYVSWIGLDEILRNYKPPRTPVPPSREGIAALQKADELDQKTDDLGNKISGLQQEVRIAYPISNSSPFLI